MMFPLMISATGILTCLLVTLIATDFKPAKQISEIESTLKLQLIVSTVLMTPVRGDGWGVGVGGAQQAAATQARRACLRRRCVHERCVRRGPAHNTHTHAQRQVVLALALTMLPATFELSVPSRDPKHDFDIKVGGGHASGRGQMHAFQSGPEELRS